MAYLQRRVKYIIKGSASFFLTKSSSQGLETYLVPDVSLSTSQHDDKEKRRCTCFISALNSGISSAGCLKTLSLEHSKSGEIEVKQRRGEGDFLVKMKRPFYSSISPPATKEIKNEGFLVKGGRQSARHLTVELCDLSIEVLPSD